MNAPDTSFQADLSVVMPLFREGAHLRRTVGEVARAVEGLGLSVELVLVDDGSPDETWTVISELSREHANPPALTVRGLRLSRNFGKEAALAAGLEHAGGRAVVVMDGDLQHPPALLPTMVAHWRAGAEVVEAVKTDRGPESAGSRWAAGLFYTLWSRLTGHDLHGASDFKLLDARVLAQWRRLGERKLFFRGMSAWLGFRTVQVPFEVPQRVQGASGWSNWQRLRLAVGAITSFSSAPLHLVTLAGLAFAAFSVALGLQTLYLKLTGQAVDGFATVIILLLIIGSVLMLGLGIVGTYIARIYDEVKGRPRFIVAECAESTARSTPRSAAGPAPKGSEAP
ncbi:MAG: glycosyltransferase family 2 protein [Rubrivivax sp.]